MAFADRGYEEDRKPPKPVRASKSVSTPARKIGGPLQFSSRAAQAMQDVQIQNTGVPVMPARVPKQKAPKAPQPKKRNKQENKGFGFIA